MYENTQGVTSMPAALEYSPLTWPARAIQVTLETVSTAEVNIRKQVSYNLYIMNSFLVCLLVASSVDRLDRNLHLDAHYILTTVQKCFKRQKAVIIIARSK